MSSSRHHVQSLLSMARSYAAVCQQSFPYNPQAQQSALQSHLQNMLVSLAPPHEVTTAVSRFNTAQAVLQTLHNERLITERTMWDLLGPFHLDMLRDNSSFHTLINLNARQQASVTVPTTTVAPFDYSSAFSSFNESVAASAAAPSKTVSHHPQLLQHHLEAMYTTPSAAPAEFGLEQRPPPPPLPQQYHAATPAPLPPPLQHHHQNLQQAHHQQPQHHSITLMEVLPEQELQFQHHQHQHQHHQNPSSSSLLHHQVHTQEVAAASSSSASTFDWGNTWRGGGSGVSAASAALTPHALAYGAAIFQQQSPSKFDDDEEDEHEGKDVYDHDDDDDNNNDNDNDEHHAQDDDDTDTHLDNSNATDFTHQNSAVSSPMMGSLDVPPAFPASHHYIASPQPAQLHVQAILHVNNGSDNDGNDHDDDDICSEAESAEQVAPNELQQEERFLLQLQQQHRQQRLFLQQQQEQHQQQQQEHQQQLHQQQQQPCIIATNSKSTTGVKMKNKERKASVKPTRVVKHKSTACTSAAGACGGGGGAGGVASSGNLTSKSKKGASRRPRNSASASPPTTTAGAATTKPVAASARDFLKTTTTQTTGITTTTTTKRNAAAVSTKATVSTKQGRSSRVNPKNGRSSSSSSGRALGGGGEKGKKATPNTSAATVSSLTGSSKAETKKMQILKSREEAGRILNLLSAESRKCPRQHSGDVETTNTSHSQDSEKNPVAGSNHAKREAPEHVASALKTLGTFCGQGLNGQWQENRQFILDQNGMYFILLVMQQYPEHKGVQGQGCRVLQHLLFRSEASKLQFYRLGGAQVVQAALKLHLDDSVVRFQACSALRGFLVSTEGGENNQHERVNSVASAAGLAEIIQRMKKCPLDLAVQQQECRFLVCLLSISEAFALPMLDFGGLEAVHTAMARHKDNTELQTAASFLRTRLEAAHQKKTRDTTATTIVSTSNGMPFKMTLATTIPGNVPV